MQIARHTTILCCLLLVLSTGAAVAHEVTVAFGQHKPPYVSLNGQHGIEVDLFREVLALNGHTLRIKIMPKRKVKFSLNKYKDFDAASSVNLSNDQFHYSDQFVSFNNIAVTRERDNITLNKVADLAPYKLGTWQGANVSLGKEFATLYGRHGRQRARYRDFASQLQQNIEFWTGNIDVLIIDRNIFEYYRKFLSQEFGTDQAVVYHHLFSKETPYYAAFKERGLRDEFNDALETLRTSGRYQEIINRYIQ